MFAARGIFYEPTKKDDAESITGALPFCEVKVMVNANSKTKKLSW